MNLTDNPGRAAGGWYLLLILVGPLRLIYIPSTLFVAGNAPATVRSIAAHQQLFRLGMVAELVCAVILVLLTLAFFRLFQRVDANLAVQVVIFGGVIPAVILFVGVVDDAAVLMVVQRATFLSVFDAAQQDGLALLFLKLRDAQNTAAELLWGIWLFPLAALVYRSRFVPRLLGVWLALNGLAYVLVSVTGELWPQSQDQVFSLSRPARLGELALMLWLLIKGARPPGAVPSPPSGGALP